MKGKGTYMRRPCSILLLCLLLACGVSVALPGGDLPETAYDESESLPCLSTPAFSLAVSMAFVRAPVQQNIVALRSSGSFRSALLRARAYPIGASLTIRDHALRC